MRIVSLLLLVGMAAAAAACRTATDDSPALVLRTYAVPKGSARALVSTLEAVLWVGEQKTRAGRAAVTPGGDLLVLAAPSVQTGVQALVDEVSKHPVTYDQTIELDYFVLLGKPASSAQPPPPGVGEVQPALDEIVRSQGPQAFTLAQRARLSTLNGNDGKLEGDKLKITQKASQTNDGLDAMVGIEFSGDRIESRVHLDPERIVVLGSTAQRSDVSDGTTLYYVVRVAPHAGGKQP
jgi:hypothetical protein